jgi:hypothetical protein
VFVEVPNDEPIRVRDAWQGLGVFQQHDDLIFLEPPGLVGADRVADLHAARGDELAYLAPRRPAQARAQHLRERVTGLLRRDGERRKGG